jgi:ferric-dicitrate binding protein FerR (iron transport regulator)
MHPGDFVEIKDNNLNKKTDDGSAILAWKDRKMIFEGTRITEAAKMIEEEYGVQVLLPDSNYVPVTGILSNDNLDVLLKALDATNNYVIERNGNTIVIRKHT